MKHRMVYLSPGNGMHVGFLHNHDEPCDHVLDVHYQDGELGLWWMHSSRGGWSAASFGRGADRNPQGSGSSDG